MTANLLAHLLVIALIISPYQSVKALRRLDSVIHTNPRARLDFYAAAMTGQWVLMPIVWITVLSSDSPLAALGLRLPMMGTEQLGIVALIAVIILSQSPIVPFIRDRMQQSPSARASVYPLRNLLPRSPAEKQRWVWLSLTAGCCEEIIFRGFLFYYAQSVLMLSTLGAITLSSAIFATSHYYQGPTNMIKVGIVGALLGVLYAATQSLFFCVVLHILLDLGGLHLGSLIASDDAPHANANVDDF